MMAGRSPGRVLIVTPASETVTQSATTTASGRRDGPRPRPPKPARSAARTPARSPRGAGTIVAPGSGAYPIPPDGQNCAVTFSSSLGAGLRADLTALGAEIGTA